MKQERTKLIVIQDEGCVELTGLWPGSADPGTARTGERVRVRGRGVARLDGGPALDVDVDGEVTVQSIGRGLIGDTTIHLTPMEGFETRVTKGECDHQRWGCTWRFESPPC